MTRRDERTLLALLVAVLLDLIYSLACMWRLDRHERQLAGLVTGKPVDLDLDPAEREL
jgi:hypothetical protein